MKRLFCFLLITFFPNVNPSSRVLKTSRDTSDVVYDLPHCRYDEIKSNVTINKEGTCGCYTETLMSNENGPFQCNTPVEVGCSIGLVHGYVVRNGSFRGVTKPKLNDKCSFIQSIMLWNLNSTNGKGIWVEATETALKYISFESSSQILVRDIDKEKWKGQLFKINFGCRKNCTQVQCNRDCVILKMEGYIEYPFDIALLLLPCVGFMFSSPFLWIIIVLALLLLLLLLFNCCLLCCFCGCCGIGRRCCLRFHPQYGWSFFRRRHCSRSDDFNESSRTAISAIEIDESPKQEKKKLLSTNEEFEIDGGVYYGEPEGYNKNANTSRNDGYAPLYKASKSSEGNVYYAELKVPEKDSEKDKSDSKKAHFKIGTAEEPLLSQTRVEDLTFEDEVYFDDTFGSESHGLMLGHRDPFDDIDLTAVKINAQAKNKGRPLSDYDGTGKPRSQSTLDLSASQGKYTAANKGNYYSNGGIYMGRPRKALDNEGYESGDEKAQSFNAGSNLPAKVRKGSMKGVQPLYASTGQLFRTGTPQGNYFQRPDDDHDNIKNDHEPKIASNLQFHMGGSGIRVRNNADNDQNSGFDNDDNSDNGEMVAPPGGQPTYKSTGQLNMGKSKIPMQIKVNTGIGSVKKTAKDNERFPNVPEANERTENMKERANTDKHIGSKSYNNFENRDGSNARKPFQMPTTGTDVVEVQPLHTRGGQISPFRHGSFRSGNHMRRPDGRYGGNMKDLQPISASTGQINMIRPSKNYENGNDDVFGNSGKSGYSSSSFEKPRNEGSGISRRRHSNVGERDENSGLDQRNPQDRSTSLSDMNERGAATTSNQDSTSTIHGNSGDGSGNVGVPPRPLASGRKVSRGNEVIGSQSSMHRGYAGRNDGSDNVIIPPRPLASGRKVSRGNEVTGSQSPMHRGYADKADGPDNVGVPPRPLASGSKVNRGNEVTDSQGSMHRGYDDRVDGADNVSVPPRPLASGRKVILGNEAVGSQSSMHRGYAGRDDGSDNVIIPPRPLTSGRKVSRGNEVTGSQGPMHRGYADRGEGSYNMAVPPRPSNVGDRHGDIGAPGIISQTSISKGYDGRGSKSGNVIVPPRPTSSRSQNKNYAMSGEGSNNADQGSESGGIPIQYISQNNEGRFPGSHGDFSQPPSDLMKNDGRLEQSSNFSDAIGVQSEHLLRETYDGSGESHLSELQMFHGQSSGRIYTGDDIDGSEYSGVSRYLSDGEFIDEEEFDGENSGFIKNGRSSVKYEHQSQRMSSLLYHESSKMEQRKYSSTVKLKFKIGETPKVTQTFAPQLQIEPYPAENVQEIPSGRNPVKGYIVEGEMPVDTIYVQPAYMSPIVSTTRSLDQSNAPRLVRQQSFDMVDEDIPFTPAVSYEESSSDHSALQFKRATLQTQPSLRINTKEMEETKQFQAKQYVISSNNELILKSSKHEDESKKIVIEGDSIEGSKQGTYQINPSAEGKSLSQTGVQTDSQSTGDKEDKNQNIKKFQFQAVNLVIKDLNDSKK